MSVCRIGLVSRKEMAAQLGISERSLSNHVKARRIPMISLGGRRLFDPSKVMAAIERYETKEIGR